MTDLDVQLRAYVPAFEQLGANLPEQTVTLSNIRQLRAATGLTWEPAAEEQYRKKALGDGFEAYEAVPGFKYVTRGVGGPILGSLGKGYSLFYNDELFGIAETIGVAALELGQKVTFLRGGETNGGRRVFLLADLGTREIAGDPSPHVRYMTLLSSHNGRGAVKVLGTDMRWHCTNALRAAEMNAAANAAAFSFRHTTKLTTRLKNAQQAITAALVHHQAIDERTTEMLRRKVTTRSVSAYLQQFALAQVVSKGNPQRRDEADASKARENAVAALTGQLNAVWRSPTCARIRNTAYGPFAAVVEYLDNVRPSISADTRFDRTMVNTERGKVLAYDLARKLF